MDKELIYLLYEYMNTFLLIDTIDIVMCAYTQCTFDYRLSDKLAVFHYVQLVLDRYYRWHAVGKEKVDFRQLIDIIDNKKGAKITKLFI